MTDATLTDAETITDSALYSRMIDDENGIFREYALPNFGVGAHIRQCDDCAGNALRSFHNDRRDSISSDLAEYDAWRAYVARTHAVAVENQQSIPEEVTPTPEDDVDTEIRAAFPGAIPDDKLGKLRALVTERNELRAKLAEQSAEIDLSDKRLWPAFGKVAAAADEAGYCAEYDRMSEAGGFPTREELREAGLIPAKEYTATVYVDVDVSFTTRIRVITPSFEAANYDDAVDEAREIIEDMLDDDDVLDAVRAEHSDVPSDATVEWTLSYVNNVELA